MRVACLRTRTHENEIKMEIGQAVRRLRSGDRIRREAWEDKDRYLSDDDAEMDDPVLTLADILAGDWEAEE